MRIFSELWGKNSKGEDIFIYTLENNFLKVEILNLGAIIKKIEFKKSKAINKNTVISYNDIEAYEKNPAYIGSIIGRTSGRIENGELNLPSKKIILARNDKENNLHGGRNSISHKIWQIKKKEDRISCTIFSPSLENNYPGNVKINVEYILNENSLILEYSATTDEETYINLTNHSYFNLNQTSTNSLYDHILEIDADYMLELNENFIPNKVKRVENTIFDFKIPKKMINFFEKDKDNIQKKIANNGIDHPYVLNQKKYMRLSNLDANISMEIETDNPGVVIYTANYFENIGLSKHSAICFETQEIPNLFRDEKLNIFPIFINKEKKYKKYTKFTFRNINSK